MPWTTNEKPDFKTLDEIREKVKMENNGCCSASDTEHETVGAAKKTTKKNSKKTSKKVEPHNDDSAFVCEIDMKELEITSDGGEEEEPSSSDLIDVRLAVSSITKDLKALVARIAALTSVIQDISLTDIPKNITQAVKKVEKLSAALYNLNIDSHTIKQQRKKK